MGKVGIGTEHSTEALTVQGNIQVTFHCLSDDCHRKLLHRHDHSKKNDGITRELLHPTSSSSSSWSTKNQTVDPR